MKVVLSIAGSDSSGGAGIQADLKTFEAFGVFSTSVITVLTAQNTTGVKNIHEVQPSFIKEQIEAVFEDFDVAALKIGMLYNKEIINLIKEQISKLRIPIVLDPVFISKSGSSLLKEDGVEAMKELFEYVSVVTPNQYEAKQLFGYAFGDSDSLHSIINAPTAVLVKNHLLETADKKISVDQLFLHRQKRVFQTPYLDTNNLHGTGCSYSSAICANLALGKTLEESIQIAKTFIYEALLHAPNIGKGVGPINHKRAGEKVQT